MLQNAQIYSDLLGHAKAIVMRLDITYGPLPAADSTCRMRARAILDLCLRIDEGEGGMLTRDLHDLVEEFLTIFNGDWTATKISHVCQGFTCCNSGH